MIFFCGEPCSDEVHGYSFQLIIRLSLYIVQIENIIYILDLGNIFFID